MLQMLNDPTGRTEVDTRKPVENQNYYVWGNVLFIKHEAELDGSGFSTLSKYVIV